MRPRPKGYGGYQPRNLVVPARHAAYSANLLVLNVLAADGTLSGRKIFANTASVENWRSFALLWKSQLDPAGWDGLLNAFEIVHSTDDPLDESPDFLVRYASLRLTKPLEAYDHIDWLVPSNAKDSTGLMQIDEASGTPYRIALQSSFLCIPEIDLLIHAAQPLLRLNPEGFNSIRKSADGQFSSITHLIAEILTGKLPGVPSEKTANALVRLIPLLLHSTEHSAQADATGASSATANLIDWLVPAASTVLPRTRTQSLRDIVRLEGGRNIALDTILLTETARKNPKILSGALDLLPSLENSFQAMEPMRLARAEPSVIADVIRVAQEGGHTKWAGFDGLTVLAALPVPKLRELPSELVDFVLECADTQNENAVVIQLIKDRYQH